MRLCTYTCVHTVCISMLLYLYTQSYLASLHIYSMRRSIYTMKRRRGSRREFQVPHECTVIYDSIPLSHLYIHQIVQWHCSFKWTASEHTIIPSCHSKFILHYGHPLKQNAYQSNTVLSITRVGSSLLIARNMLYNIQIEERGYSDRYYYC